VYEKQGSTGAVRNMETHLYISCKMFPLINWF
jgi:hypothetical protein